MSLMKTMMFADLDEGKRIALLGAAGSGKSTETGSMFRYKVLHLDDYFFYDSKYRYALLGMKSEAGFPEYRDACQQMNWWNWSNLEKDINTESYAILVEGALLGPPQFWDIYDVVYFLAVSPAIRLSRMIERDSQKRDPVQIAARFLITEYSENAHYREVLPYLEEKGKVRYFNEKGEFTSRPVFNKYNYLPMEIPV